jgi:hypothetical protein
MWVHRAGAQECAPQIDRRDVIPALNVDVGPPIARVTVVIISATAAGSEMSAPTLIALPPSDSTSFAVRSASRRISGFGRWFRATSAPSRANPHATAAPIPRDAPVINATRPRKRPMLRTRSLDSRSAGAFCCERHMFHQRILSAGRCWHRSTRCLAPRAAHACRRPSSVRRYTVAELGPQPLRSLVAE